ncbi:acyltransferase [Mucilaginibacter limnophilus]|uniref:Acyltransferase n=1 Tax=Mucilaginibacter limnophilus TaxID=1932778 RepID=A0A3S3TFE4_9SPHI|nr:acyltransferase [Mucilaginibacter limnophilus]RVT99778.1 acyltransferase [Mucilaginibacter limnophilus]
MKTLSTAIVRGNNNYGLIRLITASMVIVNHSTVLFPNNFQMIETGYLRLWVFFFLSGLFITSSFDHSKTRLSFIIMRVCRLWPALIVCTLFTVFLIGPIVTKVSLYRYFTDIITWKYMISNSLIFNLKYYLPGVFTENHVPGIVNNSLWTIPMELKCYSIVFILGCLGVFKNKWLMIVSYILVALYLFSTTLNFWEVNPNSIILYMLFLMGSVSYFFKKYIYLDYKVAIILLIISIIVYKNLALRYVIPFAQIAIIYNVLTLGASNFLKNINLPGDYSYGIYIYGFLVQQTIACYLPAITPFKSLLITMPVVIVLGALSWHFIENPVLKFGKKLSTMNKLEIQIRLKSFLKINKA